jgi:phenylacetate-CoA ligase
MIFESEFECLERRAMTALQSERLGELIAYVNAHVTFYQHQLSRSGINGDEIKSLADLARLPITRKQDLRDHYPFGLFAVPRSDTIRVHASSGTTGKPTVVGYTRADIDLFAAVNARCLAMGGAEPGMMLHNAYGYGLFTGGLGLHYGAERLGLTVVPVSGGMTERQLTLIEDFKPDVISCTPSYGLTLAQEFAERGRSAGELSPRFGVVGAEPWTEVMRTELDAGLGIRATNIYGLSEIIGPGVSCECVEARAGSHINEDHFLAEIVDPDTGEQVPDGQEGVLLLTTLTKQALPLIRYWTGDITSLDREPCACGRTLTRMQLIKGRTDDMLIIRGVNLYPTEVELVLGRIEELGPHYRLIVTRDKTLDELTVEAELTNEVFERVGSKMLSDESIAADQYLDSLRNRVAFEVRDTLGVGATVKLAVPGSVPRSQGGKLNRVDDRRALT